jgi:hypothetical protein
MANCPLIDTAVRGDREDGETYAPAMSASMASGAAGAMVVGSGSRSPPGTPQAGAGAYGGKSWTLPAAGDNMITIDGQSYLDKAGEFVPLK